ncbi:unnamed protein product [Triticum turgidum subsp. durum]|uniref:Uncharacterized protein n=1 Tax=Triticum turgidum subsp. durum TaxID=4567 RepID=A0A9R0YE49_TRITD|nr:unnamed protein product [Triticum turgidum subsp. durum]
MSGLFSPGEGFLTLADLYVSLAGVQVADAPIKLSGVNKRGWKYIKASQKTVQDTPAAETPAAATATATA